MNMECIELNYPELPYYLDVRMIIDHSARDIQIAVISRIHVNKVVILGASWDIDYNRRFIAQEALLKIIRRYDLKPLPRSYR